MTVLEVTDTEIGTFYLTRREVAGVPDWVYEILIGSDVLMTSLSSISESKLSTRALEQHTGKSGLRVLIGGLGLGYTAQAALEDPRVENLRVVEKMDFVIDWMKRGLLPLSEKFAADTRLAIVQSDVYSELLGPKATTYDLILIDVDHAPDDPLSAESMPFYTVEGQKRVAAHLSPGGVLGVWSAVADNNFSAVLAEVYPESHWEEVSWQDIELPEADFANVLFFARAPH